ncbi:MAG: hypothetical protein QOE57_3183 [Acidimicrobiaceae bacterium]|nr:hypothetical protein [Acidimicrobiaceae bacterium]
MTRTASRGPAARSGRHRWMPAEQRLDDIARRIVATVEGIGFDSARALAADAANGSAPLAWLQWHLQERPDALTSGASDVPLVVLRLIKVLRAAGHESVTPIRCLACRQPKAKLELHVEGGRLCVRCAAHFKAEACSRCAAVAPVYGRDGPAAVCGPCWHHDPSHWEPCGHCGQLAQVRARNSDGSAVGRCCFPSPLCAYCSKRRATTVTGGDGSLCERCRQRREGTCDSCDTVGPVVTTSRPALCPSCYRARRQGCCASCRRRRPVSNCHALGGKALCRQCWPRPHGDCARCGNHRQLQVNWPIGPVCGACYADVRRHPEPCAACDQRLPLIGVDIDGNGICSGCCGVAFDYTCRRCQLPGYMIVEGICERCNVTDLARRHLARADGTIPAIFDPFLDALAATPSPASTLKWLGAGRPAATLLRQLAASPDQVSHDLLDTLPQDLTLHRLRRSLMHVGVLEQRVDYLDRISPWLESVLADQSPVTAHLVRTYAHWSVLRRARHRSRRRPFTAGSASWAHAKLRGAVALLNWIDAQGSTLQRLDQGALDRWITAGTPSAANAAREFVQWARQRNLTGEVAIPIHHPQASLVPISEDERWHHLKRCLKDTTLPIQVRLAGSLILVYGIPVSRITTLRADQIRTLDRRTTIQLGAHRLVVAPAIAGLLHHHQEESAAVCLLDRSTPKGPEWLFPGGFPGRPAVAALYRQLRQHGIPHIRRARSAALITLAADLPAPVLADLLDIHITTAVQWSRHAQNDWAADLAARSAAAAGDTGDA